MATKKRTESKSVLAEAEEQIRQERREGKIEELKGLLREKADAEEVLDDLNFRIEQIAGRIDG